MKLGILITDRVRDELIGQHGDYPDMFENLLLGTNNKVDISRFYVQKSLPDKVDCDGYIITGSRHSVYDDLPWIVELVGFIREALSAGKKIIGVCFGHQLMAHHFGGLVEKFEKGWAVGVHKSEIILEQPWMKSSDGQSSPEFSLISSHQDQVVRMPSNAHLYATNDFCPIAGFIVGHQVMTVQGHPEFDKEYARALLDLRKDVLGEDLVERGKATLERPTDQKTWGRWMLNFLQDSTVDVVSSRRLDRFRVRAEKVMNERGHLYDLLRRASQKMERAGRKTFGDTWDELVLLIELVQNWSKGDYQDVSNKTIVAVIAAIIYLVTPFDAVPDFLLGWGYLDDLAILKLVIGQVKTELDKFKRWKERD
jgi:GMP synthase-like glutamine amidotransferase/uncharacterized membrane protein YkvA (DUF1232 family)